MFCMLYPLQQSKHKRILILIATLSLCSGTGFVLWGQAHSAVSVEEMGFVRSVGDHSLTFDDATWLTGTAGEDAAIRAGICTDATRAECLPNDFFIENTDTSTVSLPVSSTVKVVMQTWQMEEMGQVAPHAIPYSEFKTLVNSNQKHWSALPYTITLINHKIVRIEEIYVP